MKNLKAIDKARALLTAHSQGDFVSKAEASQCVIELSELPECPKKTELIINSILEEVARAQTKHPKWPRDFVYAATIVSEENGELTRACLQFESEGGDIEEVRKEAIQTAATCIRLLSNIG